MEEITLKKISEYEWEIPKEGKMNVPGKIFGSEKLIKAMKKDKTLLQVKNVAMLPGIIGASIALSDAHQGYGFPIGGVAAFDLEKGVVSPGGIGYDINCLEGNSRILNEFGYYKKIEDFEENNEENKKEFVSMLDKENLKLINSKPSIYLKKNSEKIIRLKTESGKELLVTEDHQIYTKRGMKKTGEIFENDYVLLYPFEGVKYQHPEKKLLVSEEDIDKLSRSKTSKLQIKNTLKSLNLLPLYSDNPRIPYLVKIIGFILGDGSLSITPSNCQIGFYGKKQDLQLIKEDLLKIGFKSYFFSRNRNHTIMTEYREYSFSRIEYSLKNNSSSLAVLLNLLGVPFGNKSEKDYSVPEWIMNSPKWYKRLFLASLFGAELSSPKTLTNSRFNFYGLVYSMNKKNSLHGISFVNQLSALLEEFQVESVLLKTRTENKSFRIRLMIKGYSQNLITFFSKINYEYNLIKRKLANAAIVWFRHKENIIRFREETMKKARELKKQGFRKSQIIEKLKSKYSNEYLIEKSIYHEGYGRTGSRIAYCFISFYDFLRNNCYGDQGFIWDRIKEKGIYNFNDVVYDISIDNINHNFIANGFVVSNCSVRLLRTNLLEKDIEKKGKKEIIHSIARTIPSGVGKGTKLKINWNELNEILREGAQWMVKKGYGEKEDYIYTEEQGMIRTADPDLVSERAKARGIGQLGSLGAGNHFLEMQIIDKIYNEDIAKNFGLYEGQITIMIHCGSRGLGHQVASDYILLMEREYGYPEQDRELVFAPILSELGKKYLKAMACAANFAFANKQLITHWIRQDLNHYYPKVKIEVVYDVCHNIAKFEKHFINGQEEEVLVLRKGATRSFGKGRKELPEKYRSTGQPVLIPGTMGTYSFVLVGTEKAENISFASTAHGAGRVESRTKARKSLIASEVKKQLEKKGIIIEAGSSRGIVEEAPDVYKDVEEVVNASHEAGIGNLVARLRPIGVVKG